MKFYKGYLLKVSLLFCLMFFSLFISGQNLEKIGKKDMLTINGGLNYNSLFYNAYGIPNRRDPFTWYFNGHVTLNFLDVSLPFTYSYSNNQSQFTQPFNMTNCNPTYKWAKAYIGYNAMNFSSYTLSGHVFMGGGIELTPQNWKISAMYGRLKKAVAYDEINQNDADMSFKRMGYGAKIGYEKNGFGAGVIYFSAKDDVNSIPYIPANTQTAPMENSVIGFNAKARISKYLNWEGEYAISGLTRNLLVSDEENNSVKNQLPLIYKSKSTSQFFHAYKTSLGFNLKIFKVGLNYEHVDPDYKTLGAYYFNNDFENITISPALTLWKGKLNLALNSGFQRNNLDQTKLSTTKRWVGSANLSLAPNTKWNINVSYSNFTSFTNMRPITDPFYVKTAADTLNFYQLSQNANATVSHMFGKGKMKQNLVLMATYQVTGEKNGNTQHTPTKIYNANLVYSLNFTPTKTSLSIGANANEMEAIVGQTLYAGPNINVAQGFLKNTMRASLGTAYNWGYFNQHTNNSVLNSRLGLTYSPKLSDKKWGKPSLSLSAVHTQKFKTNFNSNAFGEFTGTLALGYSF